MINTGLEIVVVGAGPVGLTAALASNAAGMSVTIVEAQPEAQPRPGSRALFVHRRSLALLAEIDSALAGDLCRFGLQWSPRRTTWRGLTMFDHTRASGGSGALPPFVSLRQRDTEAFLRDACRRARIPIYWDTAIADARTADDRVTLRTAAGGTMSAAYVLAADGGRSAVRRALGIAMQGAEAAGFHVVVDILDTPGADPLPAVRSFHYEHPRLGGRNVLTIPFRGGWQVDLQCRADDAPEDFVAPAALARWLPMVGPSDWSDRVDWVATYCFKQAVCETFVDAGRRTLLIGDAAHLFPPFGARGLNSGIADAVAAVEAIRAACPAKEEHQRRAAIDRFADVRRAAALRNAAAADAALAHMQNRTVSARVRRRVAATLAPLVPRLGEWLDTAPYAVQFGNDY